MVSLVIYEKVIKEKNLLLRLLTGKPQSKFKWCVSVLVLIQQPHTYRVNSCTRLQRLRGLNAVLSTLSGTKSPPI